LGGVGGSVCSCVSSSANSDCLASGTLVNRGGSNVLDSDSTPDSGSDCVVCGNGALIDSGGNGNNSSHNSLLLTVTERAVSNGRCTGRDCDDRGFVDSCGAGRTVLGTVGLDSSGLSSARDARDGALGADSLHSSRGEGAGGKTG